MIIKVELWHTVGGKLSQCRVTHDTGIRRVYKTSNAPKTVVEFINTHIAQTKTINGSVIKKVYVYDKVRTANNEERSSKGHAYKV